MNIQFQGGHLFSAYFPLYCNVATAGVRSISYSAVDDYFYVSVNGGGFVRNPANLLLNAGVNRVVIYYSNDAWSGAYLHFSVQDISQWYHPASLNSCEGELANACIPILSSTSGLASGINGLIYYHGADLQPLQPGSVSDIPMPKFGKFDSQSSFPNVILPEGSSMFASPATQFNFWTNTRNYFNRSPGSVEWPFVEVVYLPPIITAGQTASGVVGTAFSKTFSLTDSAIRPVTSWAAAGLPGWATINPTTGEITGTPQDSGSTTITLTADGSGGSDSKTVTISIAVGPPIITAPQSFSGKVGDAFSATPALSDASDRPASSWSATGLPAGLLLNSATGAITGAPTAKGSFNASFRATGSGGIGAATIVAFTISEGAPIITANQTATGIFGQPFSKIFSLTDAANRPATSWQASGLPAWASLATATGSITGTPTSVGTFSITLTATGPGGVSSLVNATITISAGPPIINPGQAFSGKVGQAFPATRITLQDAVNRAASAWAVVGGASLPPGLSLNADTGILSGEPTAIGSFTTQIRASSSAGQSTVSVSFAISAGAPRLVGETIKASVGLKISRQVGRFDVVNRPITSFSATGLPVWLSLDAATGRLEGTPASTGAVSFTVTATGPGGQGAATIEISVGAGVGYYELTDADTGKIHLRTLSREFVISNLEPSKTYNFELRAWNGGGASAPQILQVTTLPLAGRPSSADRLRILPVTEKFTASTTAPTLPVSVPSPDALMKNVWVKRTTQAAAQFSANSAAFGGGFIRGEDVIEADWIIDGLVAAQYDRTSDKILLTENAPFSLIRHETPNFTAAYGGENIDGQLRQTILHARISTTDSRPSQWIAEAYLLPGVRFRLHVLFYTNMFNTILRVGGPTLHFGSFKVPHTLEAQEARTVGTGLRQAVNADGSQAFVRTVIDCGEDEHVVFSIKNIGGMRDTQTSLIVVAER